MLLFILFLFLSLLYYQMVWNYWKRKGVKQGENLPLFGSFLKVFLCSETKSDVYERIYKNSDEKYVGIYEFGRPVLVLKDLKMIQKVLVKNFGYFVDHPQWVFNKECFVHFGTFNLRGDLWRAMRYKLTPTFSAARVKSILPRIDKILNDPGNQKVEMRRYLDLCSADAIAAFYGTEIENKDDFQTLVSILSEVDIPRYYKLLVLEYFPKIGSFFGMNLVPKHNDLEFRELIKTMVKIGGSEFSKLLDDIGSKNEIEMKSKDFDSSGSQKEQHVFKVTDELIIGQAAQFLVAGLDTTSNTMSYVAYDLCANPEKQTLAWKEVKEAVQKHGGFTYEALLDMKYLGACLKESTRLHPIFSFAFRQATRDYVFDDGLKISKGTKIVIPTLSLHLDEKYYRNPSSFLPERWLEDEILQCTWLPFGDGPRQCIGMRYAILVMKMIFAKLLLKYEMKFDDEKLKLEGNPLVFMGEMKNLLYCNLIKRE